MAIPTSPINYTEALISELIADAFDDSPYAGLVPFYNGMSDGEKKVPCVVSYAQNATVPAEISRWLRNYEVSLAVEIHTKADLQQDDVTTGLEAHRAIVEAVMNRLSDTADAKAIASAAGHKVYEIEPNASNPDLDGEQRTFTTLITATVCLVLDLPAE